MRTTGWPAEASPALLFLLLNTQSRFGVQGVGTILRVSVSTRTYFARSLSLSLSLPPSLLDRSLSR